VLALAAATRNHLECLSLERNHNGAHDGRSSAAYVEIWWPRNDTEGGNTESNAGACANDQLQGRWPGMKNWEEVGVGAGTRDLKEASSLESIAEGLRRPTATSTRFFYHDSWHQHNMAQSSGGGLSADPQHVPSKNTPSE
jgi:hypothetical protein